MAEPKGPPPEPKNPIPRNTHTRPALTWLQLVLCAEVAGFGAIAVGAAVFGWLVGGPAAAAAVGLVIGGGEMVYLAREFAAGAGGGEDE